jgi:hypothetical protein
MLLADLQGVRAGDVYCCTDPAIQSTAQAFGSPDLGPLGIVLFFLSHTCSDSCKHFKTPRITAAQKDLAFRLYGALPTLNSASTSQTFATKGLATNPELQKLCQQMLDGELGGAGLTRIQQIVAGL